MYWKPFIDDIFKKETSYMWEHTWLEGFDSENCAKYTVVKKDIFYDNEWVATWWHGNRGYNIGKAKTLEEAKEICENHFLEMYNKIQAIKELLERRDSNGNK